jgi:hypothetical protein
MGGVICLFLITFAEKRKKHMKQHVVVFYLLFCLISCSQHSEYWETLVQVESFIVERPDSALNVLQDVGVYMKMSSHYNNSSCIREKLGLVEFDTNLGIYIKKLLKSF